MNRFEQILLANVGSLFYTGIGSRETPKDIQALEIKIAHELELLGYILRSGAAEGSDMAFESGVEDNHMKEIYLPWKGFNKHPSHLYPPTQLAMQIASQIHPAWQKMSNPAHLLMARNTHQVLGLNIVTPSRWSRFIIAWTKDGNASGGTGQAIRLANTKQIPVFNLQRQQDRDDVCEAFSL